jgi:hypothetical protein
MRLFHVALSVTYAHTGWRGEIILAKPIDLKERRKELKTKRESLFNKYLQNPADTQLALEIKELDDQVAECVQQLHLELK